MTYQRGLNFSNSRVQWTKEHEDIIRDGYETGLSVQEIAARLGEAFNRNMVIGKAKRLDLIHPSIKARPQPFVPEPDTSRHECQWPMWPTGQRATGKYCGAAPVDGTPYCEEHCAGAYTPANVKHTGWRDLRKVPKWT